jgi:hypothetical protein
MQAKPRPSVWGCVLTFVFVAILGYGAFAGFGFAWWGPGFAGALAGRHAPERVRAASTVYIYDYVIEVEATRVVFRNSLWMSMRRALLASLVSALVVFLYSAGRRRDTPRAALLAISLGLGIATFAISKSRTREVSVPRGVPVRLDVRWFEFGGGRSGTKNTASEVSGWQIVTSDGTVLVRLPWNSLDDAEIWRGLIAEKIQR